jgi:hypothetical protein
MLVCPEIAVHEPCYKYDFDAEVKKFTSKGNKSTINYVLLYEAIILAL